MLAAEYAFGLLDVENISKVEKRLKGDVALTEDVAFWEERLAATLLGVRIAKPPKDVISRVETSLFGEAAHKAAARTAFPWKKFVVGVVVVKLSLLALWYSQQPSRALLDSRPGQAIETPVSR